MLGTVNGNGAARQRVAVEDNDWFQIRCARMTFSLDAITAQLERHRQLEAPAVFEAKTRAAVAMILRQGKSGLELLFIQRAVHRERSLVRQLSFPAARCEQMRGRARPRSVKLTRRSVSTCPARTTWGQMPVVRGSPAPVQVSCFVYWLNGSRPQLELDGEVQDTYWADLDELDDPERRLVAPVRFGGEIRGACHQAPLARLSGAVGTYYRPDYTLPGDAP